MYEVVLTRKFRRRLGGLPAALQRRIVHKLEAVALDPYGPHNNVTKMQGHEAYRLRVGDWRVIYMLHDGRLVLTALELDTRGGIY